MIDYFRLGNIFESKRIKKLLNDLPERGEASGVIRQVTSYDQDFARHGTLAAGLVGARLGRQNNEALAYFGADPMCEIIPINTPFSPGFRELSLALIYAWLKEADVICMPRGATPPDARAPSPDEDEQDGEGEDDSDTSSKRPGSAKRINDPRLSRLTRRDDGFRELFEKLLDLISQEIPVLLAAGNDARKRMAYPAALAKPIPDGEEREEFDSLITIGAANGRCFRSSYSSGKGDTGLTAYAPSDDEEQLHRRDMRYDEAGDRFNDHNLKAASGENSTQFASWSVLSTDVPGLFGQEPGGIGGFTYEGPTQETASFASFGGTSASVAIAAGVVGLAQRAYRIRRNEVDGNLKDERIAGRVMKKLLLGALDIPPEDDDNENENDKVPLINAALLVAAAGNSVT